MSGAYTIKHYVFVMCGFCSKLVCLFELVKVCDNYSTTLAYHRICPFYVHDYESGMFYYTGPGTWL